MVFDCPGQIELYSHLSVFKTFVEYLKSDGWSVCVVYCLDCHFMTGALQRELGQGSVALTAPCNMRSCPSIRAWDTDMLFLT